MKVHCPECGARVPADDVDLHSQLARCRSCDSVFSFRRALESENREPNPRTPLTPRPGQLRVETRGDELVITRPWYRPWHLGVLLFVGLWTLVAIGLLLFFTGLTSQVDAPFGRPIVRVHPFDAGPPFRLGPTSAAPWYSGLGSILSVVPLAFVIIGWVGGYMALAGVVNKTVIRLGRRLSIHHEPLPWPGNRTIDATQVRQLYVARRERYHHRYVRHHHHHHHPTHTVVEPICVTWFELRAILADGTSLTLIDRIDDEEEAAWLERAIEQRLGLADHAVQSEYRPRRRDA